MYDTRKRKVHTVYKNGFQKEQFLKRKITLAIFAHSGFCQLGMRIRDSAVVH